MSELIVPNVIPTFVGERLLATIHHYNVTDDLGLVYRGGLSPQSKADAEIPYWWLDDDGPHYADSEYPVVCADPNPLVPAFCAVAPFGKREYFGKKDDGVRFRVVAESADVLLGSLGYVAVYCGKDFTAHDGSMPMGWPFNASIRLPEVRAYSDQIPLFNVQISGLDFLHLLAVDNPRSSLEFCPQLAGL